MRAANLFRAGIAALLLPQLAVALGSVVLLARMSPAIDRILEANVASLEATERMLVAMNDDDTTSFAAALAVAQGNITEAGEAEIVTTLADAWPAALAGEPAARGRVLGSLGSLADLNRNSMRRASDNAHRLGSAGSWAVVFLGLLGFFLSIAVLRRVELSIVRPLDDLLRVIEAAAGGDLGARCAPAEGTQEIVRIRGYLDRLLDHWAGRPSGVERDESLFAAGLNALMEQRAAPTLMLGPDRRVIAGNRAGLDMLMEGAVDVSLPPGTAGGRAPEAAEALDGGLTLLTIVPAEEVADDRAGPA